MALAERPALRSALAIIVEEALGAVLAPRRCGEVVDEALEAGGLDTMPDRPMAMRIFLEGPLFSVLTRHMSVPDAIELVSQVRGALDLALSLSSDDRPVSDVRERPALPAARTSAFVVTNASVVVFLLADVLGDAVDVLTVAPSELRGRLAVDAPRLVIVDRRYPSVDTSICATLKRMPASGVVVWWAAEVAEQLTVGRLLRGGPRVVTTAPDLTLADLGALCRDLLDG